MRIVYCVLISIILSLPLYAQGVELKPYGFIRGDMVYSSKGVLSCGNPNLSSPQTASDLDQAALGFTAKNSRVGLKGSYGEDLKVGGLVEIDFFTANGFDTNVNPRLRLAYASLSVDNFEFRFGQQWDLFSPLNPNTVNVNGNLWYSGNLGFRRGQIQASYKMQIDDIQPMLQASVGEAARETTSGLGDDNKAVLPMVQGRLSAKFPGDFVIGFYVVYAAFSPVPDTSYYDFNTSGFGIDFTLPLHQYFEIQGEVNSGSNLNNSNLFTIAGPGNKTDERKTLAMWASITSKIAQHFQVALGGGLDQNKSENIPSGIIEQNFLVYADFIFPIAYGFSISAEAGNINTKVKGTEENNTALYAFLSGKITF